MRKVAIVIFTYKRHEALLRVVAQCLQILNAYRGHNCYELCVSDSERANPRAQHIRGLGVKYCTNPGTGFDDNVYHFWANNLERYDFIFNISDDDLFAPWLNPLYLLDAAMESGHHAAIFNHRYYTLGDGGNIDLGKVNFPEPELLYDKDYLLLRLMHNPPSHIATLYATTLLRVTLAKSREFRGTLHLYAVPVLLAAASKALLYSDHVLCLFHDAEKLDGAWSGSANVMYGLLEFLRKLKQLFPDHLYRVAESGYFENFFAENSWLRGELQKQCELKSEAQLRDMLAA